MPTVTLRATQWDYDSDLNSPPGRWSCEFVETKARPSHSPDEVQSRQGQTQVAIDVLVQGQTGRLADGIVREWGFRETPKGVVSTASGLDLKARLLDFKPSRRIEFKGLQVLGPDGTVPTGGGTPVNIGTKCDGTNIQAVYFETFQSVAAAICAEAGYTAVFQVYNYILGQDIVWEPDRSANDILAQLAAPFNATERYKLDIFVEPNNNIVRFHERGRATVDLVEIDYLQLTDRQITEFDPPAVNDVQVAGASYSFTEPDCASGVPTEGAMFIDNGVPTPYTIIQRTEDRESYDITTAFGGNLFSGSFDVFISETVLTKFFDVSGNMVRQTTNRRYENYVVRGPNTGVGLGIFPKIRFEDTEMQFEFNGPHGEPTRTISTTFVRDNTVQRKANASETGIDPTTETYNIAQFTQREEQETVYDKGGDPVRVISKTYRAKEPLPRADGAFQSSGLMLEREVELVYFWSKGQRFRIQTTRNFSRDLPGFQISSSTVTEPATGRGRPTESAFHTAGSGGRIGTWGPGGTDIITVPSVFPQIASGNIRQATKEIKAGPDHAHAKFSFGMLGVEADCEYFRQKVLGENTALRYEGQFTLLPDLNVREGVNLRVVNAPSRWRTNEFYVVARSARHSAREMTMGLRALAWL